MKFRMNVRIKDCDKQFHEDFPPGVIATQDVELEGTEGASETQLAMAVMGHSERFLNETVTVDIMER